MSYGQVMFIFYYVLNLSHDRTHSFHIVDHFFIFIDIIIHLNIDYV
jgi:hypothetical protein